MSAIHTHFARLRTLLPSEQVDELERAYRADAAADSRASRRRTRERQARNKAAREALQKKDKEQSS
jgi:hypothetical protein